LVLWEVIVFLNLLGFDKQDGCWTIPQGISLIEGDRSPTLSALGKALVRVPDLEDGSSGLKARRKVQRGDQILNQYQMMALRLRISAGLEDETDFIPTGMAGGFLCSAESNTIYNASDEDIV
jgi:hypothetical protein